MTSTKSFSKRFKEWKQVYIWSVKKNIGMTALFAALLFVLSVLPFVRSMSVRAGSSSPASVWSIDIFIGIISASVLPITLIFSIIMSVRLYDYMQKKRSVDLFHSLPVGRVPILLGRWCAGLTVLFVPVIITFCIFTSVLSAYGLAGGYLLVSLNTMLKIMLISAANFTFCVFMAVCSGTTMDAVLSVIGINVCYPIFILCSYNIINYILPGVNLDMSSNPLLITAFSPLLSNYATAFTNCSYDGWWLGWWLFFTAALLTGACVIYKKRKSEVAENNFAIPIPKIIIRFFITAAVGMGIGLSLFSQNTPGFFFGVLCGSLIAHVAVEAIYSRGFKHLKKSMVWYGVFAAAFLVFYGSLATGFFGYDTRIPSAGDVKLATVDVNLPYSEHNYSYTDTDDSTGIGCNTIYNESGKAIVYNLKPVFESPESIEKITGVNKSIVESKRSAGFPYSINSNKGTNDIVINYKLKNGRTFVRTYGLYDSGSDTSDKYEDLVSPITALPEYSAKKDMIFYIQPKNIESITQLNIFKNETLSLTDEEREKLLTALQNDYLNKRINRSESDTFGTVYPNVGELKISFQENFEPENEALKAMLGNYKGKINLEKSTYKIYGEDSETYKLLSKIR